MATDVKYISAESYENLADFVNMVTKTRSTVVWTFGETYDVDHGWRVCLEVGDIALVHNPRWARRFIKMMRTANTPEQLEHNKQVPWPAARRQAFEDMLGEWYEWGTRALRRNANGDVPASPLESAMDDEIIDNIADADRDAQERHDARIAAQDKL